MVRTKERVCWICDRSFINGRALGGHQKSHYAFLPLPPKAEGQQSGAHPSPDLTLRVGVGNPIGRRSRRRRPAPVRIIEAVPEETLGDQEVISDNEAAGCLLMLWEGKNLKKKHSPETSVIEDVTPTTEVVEQSSESSDVDDNDDDDYDYKKTFSCPHCDRTFGTPQGLGGHKRVHYKKAHESEQDSSSARVGSKTYTIDLNLMPEPEDSNEG